MNLVASLLQVDCKLVAKIGQKVRNEMGMPVTNKELQKYIKSIDYKGCKNCKHQIEPLRMCKWAEQGGDGRIHLVCPMWDKAESEVQEC